MNFKRGKPKQARAGCLMCKPNKFGHGMENELQHKGFGKLRDEAHAKEDLRPRNLKLEREIERLFSSYLYDFM